MPFTPASKSNSSGFTSASDVLINKYQQEANPVETPEQKLEKQREQVAGFIGGKQLAQGLGQSLAQHGNAKRMDETLKNAIDIQGKIIKLIKEKKALGQDTTDLELQLKKQDANISEISGNTEKVLNPNDLTKQGVVGSAIQLGANALPIGKLGEAVTSGAKSLGMKAGADLLGKSVAGATTGYAYDVGTKMQNPDNTTVKDVLKPGIGTYTGASLPIAGAVINKLVKPVVSRLTKGLASGLSGVGTDTIDTIIQNPEKAQQFTRELQQKGNQQVLKEQAQSIVDGVSKIKQEASKAYGEGLDKLASTDIDPSVFRQNTQEFLDKVGVTQSKGNIELGNVEFTDPKNISKATELIKKLDNIPLDGKSLRNFTDELTKPTSEGGVLYRTATTDERISFNRFVNDLANSLRNAINQSTDKLSEINSKYSQDLQLSDAVQSIFGNVQFKNIEEINNIAKKIDSLAQDKALSPTVVQDFFNRIGNNPNNFKTKEAVRQISKVAEKSNTLGISWSEILRSVTSSVVTPKLVRNIAILTGKTEPAIKALLEKTAPTARKALLESLANSQK